MPLQVMKVSPRKETSRIGRKESDHQIITLPTILNTQNYQIETEMKGNKTSFCCSWLTLKTNILEVFFR